MKYTTSEREAYQKGVEDMGKRAFQESWQMGVGESELDAYELRLKIAAKELKEKP